MKLRNSTLATAVVASFVLAATSACNGGGKEPVQDVTFLTMSGAGGRTLALGYSAGRGVHLARINASSTLNMAKSQATGETPRGGTSFFSGSLSGSSSFNGSTGGSAAFSGSTPATVSFSGSTGAVTTFSGTSILNGAACDLSALCDLATLICSDPQADCSDFTEAECLAAVNSPEGQASIAEAFGEDPELAAIFCAFVNFISCIYSSGGSLDSINEAAAEQCAQSSGLIGLFSQEQTSL